MSIWLNLSLIYSENPESLEKELFKLLDLSTLLKYTNIRQNTAQAFHEKVTGRENYTVFNFINENIILRWTPRAFVVILYRFQMSANTMILMGR